MQSLGSEQTCIFICLSSQPWPEEVSHSDYTDSLSKYWYQCTNTFRRLMQCIALAIGKVCRVLITIPIMFFYNDLFILLYLLIWIYLLFDHSQKTSLI